MTGRLVSRRSSILRRTINLLATLAAIASCLAPGIVSGQEPVVTGPVPFHGPSGSATGNVQNTAGGGGILIRPGYIAGDTVGRNDSIAHIDAMPYITIGDGLYFGDARLVRANEGGLAWTFGGGLRHYLADIDAVLGVHGYFDRDQITGAHFKQWSAGAELLAAGWEWRGNYYKPFGQLTDQVGVRADPDSVRFSGNSILFDRIRTLATALEGWDTELGVLLPGRFAANQQIRAFGGAYLYETPEDDIVGWKARLQGNLCEWMELNLQYTNDNTFDSNLILGVALNFGGFRQNSGPHRPSRSRLGDPVRRNYNIVTAEIDVVEADVEAINPGTGVAYNIVHVNSNAVGPFLGTVESPFRTIQVGQAAGGDIVFVHAGSVYDTAPANEVLLNPSELIYGEGRIVDIRGDRLTVHPIPVPEVGLINMPASPTFFLSDFTLERPMLINSGSDAATLADDSQFSGFVLDTPGRHGIFAAGVDNAIANQNLIQNTVGDGVFLLNPTGEYTFLDTVIQDTSDVAFHVAGGDATVFFTSSDTEADPGFGAIDNTSDFAVQVQNTTGGSVNFTFATIDDTGGNGISIENAGGDVTVDNANIVSSLGNGINILGGTGFFTFRSTIRNGTTIDDATLASVNIDGLEAGGRVSFIDPLLIDNRQSTGINVVNTAGRVDFSQNVVVTDIPGGVAEPGVNFQGNLPTAITAFQDDLIMTVPLTGGGLASGPAILITQNQATADLTQRANFSVGGNTIITNYSADHLQIIDDAAAVGFDAFSSSQRDSRGILIDRSSGLISFRNLTSILNESNSAAPGIEITTSDASVRFENANILNATGAPAVLLTDNIAGIGDAVLQFNNLDITSNAGDGLFGINNTNITILDGTIDSQGATGVDIEDSGINITMKTVNSNASDHGIRLVNTDSLRGFSIVGDPFNPNQLSGFGGVVTNHAVAGVFLRNAGTVRLRQMSLLDNEIGIDTRIVGLTEDSNDSLQIEWTEISTSDVHAIFGENQLRLFLTDSFLDDNGDDAALGRESIRLEYRERPNDDPLTTRPEQFDNPYVVQIDRTEIIDNSDDAVVIQGFAGAVDAFIEVTAENSQFEVNDAFDPTADPTNDVDDSGVIIDWNGPLTVEFIGNEFRLLAQNADDQIGLDVFQGSITDFSEILVDGNNWLIQNDTLLATLGRNVALSLDITGPSNDVGILVQNNIMDMNGGDNTGMFFEMSRPTAMTVRDNIIVENSFRGRGMLFNRLVEPSIVTVEGNQIGLANQGNTTEIGIEMRAFGVINLRGLRDNLVIVNPPGADFIFRGATPNGFIFVNGVQRP